MTRIPIGFLSETEWAYLKSKEFTTHVAVLGATGSGKTGLLLSLAEWILYRKLPILMVDIKGDLLNLADNPEKGYSVRCITPGADIGESVNIFAGLNYPDKVSSTVSSALALVKEDFNPITSKAHPFLVETANLRYSYGEATSLVDLVEALVNPPFDTLGAMPVGEAFQRRARLNLASKLNNLATSQEFKHWRQGAGLDIDSLFHQPQGRPTAVVYSVAHLSSEVEQQAAISLLLEEFVRWTKKQPGSTDLKKLLMIDECAGLLPPAPKSPATKAPIMLLLKQARAFGVGCVLATQNPVDLDYKAMSNCQTWMVGRLRMEGDRKRLVKGMAESVGSVGPKINGMIAGLKSREFMVVRGGEPFVCRSLNVDAKLTGPVTPLGVQQMYEDGLIERGEEEEEMVELVLDTVREKKVVFGRGFAVEVYVDSP